jgi:ComF family protein
LFLLTSILTFDFCLLTLQPVYYLAMLPELAINIKNILFPKLCVGCRKSGTLLCDNCWPKIEFVYAPICPVCRGQSVAGLTHPGCQAPQGLDGLICLAYYRGPVKSLVRQLKYQGATVTQELVAQLLSAYLDHQEIFLPPGIVVPIPLHPSALNKRGFNQAEVIANVMTRQLQLPIITTVLSRVKNTASQTKLTKEQRQINMRGAFALDTSESVKGATFIVVDDVFTTGATLREAAKVLKRAGAAKVFGFTLAQD